MCDLEICAHCHGGGQETISIIDRVSQETYVRSCVACGGKGYITGKITERFSQENLDRARLAAIEEFEKHMALRAKENAKLERK